MKVLFFCLLIFSVFETGVGGTQVPVSEDTEACIDCHILIHPGIVSDWEKGKDKFSLAVEIPPNTTATVCVPRLSFST